MRLNAGIKKRIKAITRIQSIVVGEFSCITEA